MIRAIGVNLGAFGAMTEVTFQNMPSYRLRRRRRALPVGDALTNFDSLLKGHRSAEFFVIPFSGHALHLSYDIVDDPVSTHPPEQDEDGLKTLKMLRNALKFLPWLRRKLIGPPLPGSRRRISSTSGSAPMSAKGGRASMKWNTICLSRLARGRSAKFSR